MSGRATVLTLKLRPDTPQTYEDIHYRKITLDSPEGVILDAAPWKQYFDLKGQAPPQSTVRNITISNVTGRFGSLGRLLGNPGQTEIDGVTFEKIEVQLKSESFQVSKEVKNLVFKQVTVNGAPFSSPLSH